MSTQGTGSINPRGYEELLLTEWGRWASNSSLGLGYSSFKQIEPQLGYCIPESEILVADRIIATLASKRVIKRWFWFQIRDIPDAIYNSAIDDFCEALRTYPYERGIHDI